MREARARVCGVRAVTVELEVRDWRESRAAGEHLALIFTLRRQDVGAQVPAIVLREKGVSGRGVSDALTKQLRCEIASSAAIFMSVLLRRKQDGR